MDLPLLRNQWDLVIRVGKTPGGTQVLDAALIFSVILGSLCPLCEVSQPVLTYLLELL